ncbi:MAG: aldo/keto reductase [Candidatus Nanopelagicales bacterium]
MLYKKFHGLAISSLGLGTLTWGQDTDDFEAREQIELFIESGGTLFDTSETFHPASLSILNSALKSRPRHSFQISLHINAYENRRHFIDNFRQVTTVLDLERIDYLVVEPRMEFQHWSKIAEELIRLYDSSEIDGILFRNVAAWQSVRLQSQLPAHLYIGEHFDYSILESQKVDRLDQVKSVDKKILASTSLASGVLTGKYRATIPADSRAASPHLKERTERYLTSQNLVIVEAVEKAALALGVSTATIALSWLRQQESIGSAIIGPRTVAQLRTLLSESNFELPSAITEALNDLHIQRQA